MYAYSNGIFYPLSMRADYESSGTWPSNYIELDEEVFKEFNATPPHGKRRGTSDEGVPVWVDIPNPPNSELLKLALASLNSEYQDDIESLNRAWLAAAVNDGVNATTKKDAVLLQINARKTRYASDRSALITLYS